MKRFFVLLLVGLITGGVLFAEEGLLIDFNNLAVADTELDFSSVAGASFTDAEKAEMKVSLTVEDWRVVLNSSARSVENQSMSYTREASVSGGSFAGQSALGVRVHFPLGPFNAWALVQPAFEIPAYSGVGGSQFDGFGVLQNVSVIKEIQVNVYGLNYPHALSIVLEDQENREVEYFLGNLEFDGWRLLTWRNPAYIEDVRNRELATYPLYPNLAPFVKLKGLRIYRDALKEGGDFVTYIKDINVIYDQATISTVRDIADEEIWGLIDERSKARNDAQIRRLGERQVLEFQARQLQDQSSAQQ